MISYWTWQIGCTVAMDARQSLSSSANQAERRAQRLPFQSQYQHFDLFFCGVFFLLHVLKRFDAPAALPSLRLCVAQSVRSRFAVKCHNRRTAWYNEWSAVRLLYAAKWHSRAENKRPCCPQGKNQRIMSDCRMKQTISYLARARG